MNTASLRPLLAGGCLAASAAAGCNLIFGITGGEPGGSGGAGTTSGTTSSGTTSSSTTSSSTTSSSGNGGAGGACTVYAGSGTTYLTDVSAANIPTVVLGNGGSISAIYYSSGDYTELKLGADPPGYCSAGALVDLSGKPKVGFYTVVAGSPYDSATFSGGPPNAYVFAQMDPALSDGGCAAATRAFGSVAGSGTVQVTGVQGQKVTFVVTGVQAVGISDPTCAGMCGDCDGQGTIQVDIKGGEADCLTSE